MAPPATASGPWAFWRSLGSPRFVCAPMVDQSELAFRSLTRQLGVGLAYTPMLHARLMVEHPAYRTHTFDPDPSGREGPVFAQLAGHDPAVLLEAGRFVQGHVDAVDLNFGCPQARKGCRRWWPATSCRAVMDRPGCAVPARADAVPFPLLPHHRRPLRARAGTAPFCSTSPSWWYRWSVLWPVVSTCL